MHGDIEEDLGQVGIFATLKFTVTSPHVFNGGSCVVLASDNGGGPGPRRRLMMDPNKRQWTMTVDYSGSDLDDGSLSCWLLTID